MSAETFYIDLKGLEHLLTPPPRSSSPSPSLPTPQVRISDYDEDPTPFSEYPTLSTANSTLNSPTVPPTELDDVSVLNLSLQVPPPEDVKGESELARLIRGSLQSVEKGILREFSDSQTSDHRNQLMEAYAVVSTEEANVTASLARLKAALDRQSNLGPRSVVTHARTRNEADLTWVQEFTRVLNGEMLREETQGRGRRRASSTGNPAIDLMNDPSARSQSKKRKIWAEDDRDHHLEVSQAGSSHSSGALYQASEPEDPPPAEGPIVSTQHTSREAWWLTDSSRY